MSGEEIFFLVKIDKFENNAKTFWQELQMEKYLCDVTLACGNKQIEAHKLRNILMARQTVHP